MNPFMSDIDLLELATSQLGMDASALMQRYYGSRKDAQHELEEFGRTGALQDSFRAMLRSTLTFHPASISEDAPSLGLATAAA